jgi:hypothetical protein
MNTQPSLELLDKLEALGFTKEAFAESHHFHQAVGHDMNAFRRYAQKTMQFQDNGPNARCHQRLELVYNIYTSHGFKNPAVFVHLARAAFLEIPEPGEKS